MNNWNRVEDNPLVLDNYILTEDGAEEFLAAVPTNKGWWIRHCVVEHGIFSVVGDSDNEPCGWDITDVTHWLPIPNPPF